MTLKLTKGQFEALHNLFKEIMKETPADITASLVKDLMAPIHEKLSRRVSVRMNGKRSWNLSLTDVQAKAYYAFFKDMDFGAGWHYEGIIIQRHLDLINKLYA